MDDRNSKIAASLICCCVIQIPLWTIETSKGLRDQDTGSRIQIPLWTIETMNKRFPDMMKNNSNSSMDDRNSGVDPESGLPHLIQIPLWTIETLKGFIFNSS
mgnify:CR=1 FL=1